MKNICVVGTGYVGLVTGTCFAEMGNKVICVDNNPSKLKRLQAKKLTIYEPGLEVLFLRNIECDRLVFTNSLRSAILGSDIVFLCLPTPQEEDGSADLTHVIDISEQLAEILKEAKDYILVVNKSTVPVGVGERVKEIIGEKGVTNFDIASNPEFLREGIAVEDFMKPARIIIGSESERALKILEALYLPFMRNGTPIIKMDLRSAELTKYASNGFLATKISYMNDLALLCEKTGANIDLVRKGMGSDDRIGNKFLYAGIGYGGSCFPKDVNALIKYASDNNSPLEILSSVEKVNRRQRALFVEKISKHFKGKLKGKKFAIWGLSFKPNTDDMREAPSITVIKYLLDGGSQVTAYDPVASENAKFYLGDRIKYSTDKYTALNKVDALIICTEWGEFRNPDFMQMKESLGTKVIFDGRNIHDLEKMKNEGFVYYSIGRPEVGDGQ